jgi:acetyl-CoA/propionyl-CoA carboxylase biotin carboxyl carrier protein
MLTDEQFIKGLHTTKYLDQELDPDRLEEAVERWGGVVSEFDGEPARQLTVTVDGRRLEVELVGDALEEGVPTGSLTAPSSSGNATNSGSASGTEQNGSATSRTGSVDANDDSVVVAEMDGTVVAVDVESGVTVESGDRLCVVEAMKMENDVMTPRSGELDAIEIAEGESIAIGDVIARFADD